MNGSPRRPGNCAVISRQAAAGVPLSRWTGPELLAEITRAGLARQLSVSSVLRILAEHPVKPWHYQSWICPATRSSPRRRP
jgi:hypothetical protein